MYFLPTNQPIYLSIHPWILYTCTFYIGLHTCRPIHVLGLKRFIDISVHRDILCLIRYECQSIDTKRYTHESSETVVHWWKAHHKISPLFAKLAKVYLGIPATSVPSEIVFSTSGDIVTAQRSALNAENVDKLIFLKKETLKA